jgi:hypothetical protein
LGSQLSYYVGIKSSIITSKSTETTIVTTQKKTQNQSQKEVDENQIVTLQTRTERFTNRRTNNNNYNPTSRKEKKDEDETEIIINTDYDMRFQKQQSTQSCNDYDLFLETPLQVSDELFNVDKQQFSFLENPSLEFAPFDPLTREMIYFYQPQQFDQHLNYEKINEEQIVNFMALRKYVTTLHLLIFSFFY